MKFISIDPAHINGISTYVFVFHTAAGTVERTDHVRPGRAATIISRAITAGYAVEPKSFMMAHRIVNNEQEMHRHR